MTARNRKPVVLFAGDFSSYATAAGFADGLRRLDWIVHDIDMRHFIGQPSASRIEKLLSRIQRPLSVKAFQDRIMTDCRTLRPDLFLTTKGVGITAAMLAEMKMLGIETANFYPDVYFNHRDFDMDTIPAYDRFITCKSFQIAWLEERRPAGTTHFLPNGYSQLATRPVYRAMAEADYTADVGYAGNRSEYKEKVLGELIARDPRLSLKVTGGNWGTLAAATGRTDIYDGMLRIGAAYAAFIQQSRINLSFHYGQAGNGWEDLISRRSFEIPACGGFMLHIDNDEIREFYDVGTEIDTFSSPEEMHDKIRFYLDNPDIREAMKARAHDRAVPAYSCAARAAELAKLFAFD